MTFLRILILAVGLSALLITSSNFASAESGQDELTIYRAKKIVTMDVENPLATAVAVRGKRIVAVGSMDDLKPWMDAYPHKIDDTFHDKVIMPGLIDPHMHPMLGAIQFKTFWLSPEAWVLHDGTVEATVTPEDFRRKLKAELARQEAKGETGMFFSWGYSKHFHGDLTRADLDEMSPKRPVMMLQRSMHETILNNRSS
jgi:predicted amidohydrolase YtcJ